MRVLVLTQVVVYPADAGPKVKTLQVLRHLAAQHEVVYCTFVRSEQEEQDAQKLREICQRVVTVPMKRSRVSDVYFMLESLATGDSFILRRDDRAEMQAMVRQLLQEEGIEVLHVDQLNMMRFVPPDWSGTVILDEHNAVWQVVERLRKGSRNPVMRWLLGREVEIVRRQEGAACRRASAVLAVSEQDQNKLAEVAGSAVQIEVIPITVDVQRFAATYEARKPQPYRLFTIGTMFWPPNSEGVAWWLREGYAHLRTLCPAVTYDIVGARPPHSLQTLAEQNPGVHLHGYVADTEPFWTGSSALAVPILSGGGVRVKILEAMAMGVPVISTTLGCEGLAVRDGEHLLIADSPQDFAQACARVLQDPQLARSLAHNARQLMLDRYDASVALTKLDSVYKHAKAPQTGVINQASIT
ncbi:glycosyltransferase [Ktedonosporobacter rubrisoli]|uniref:Glycosyltransferase n=1 Tax=Ktedonosporobacter rubrisoli TaxID=2509675 RepID=A0A4P6K2A3_KTERU|nr:glycosyltransferase family 4 protein [Ktedonosporobacter rubrisoli]QBD82022.1 glycosyltransferase [Ktedonosporobacter rubrisoli]